MKPIKALWLALALLAGCACPIAETRTPQRIGGSTIIRFPQLAGGGPLVADANGGLILGTGGTTAPPLAASWVHVNFGGGTSIIDSVSAGAPTVYLSDFTTGGAEILWGVTDPTTITGGAHYTLQVRYRPNLVPDNTGGHNSTAGVFVSDATKHISFQYVYVGSAMHMQVQEWTDSNTPSGGPLYDQNFNFGINADVCLEVKDDGANRQFTFAVDCVNYMPASKVFQHASGTFLTETRFGAMISPINAGGAGNTVVSWKRTTP